MKSTVMRVEECCAFPASLSVVHSHCLPTLKAEAMKLLPSPEVTLCPQQRESGRKVVSLSWSVWLCPGQGDLLPRKVSGRLKIIKA